MIQDFKGKTAVLTGAGSGFGLECARIGAARGMNLVLVDVQQDALDKAQARQDRPLSGDEKSSGPNPRFGISRRSTVSGPLNTGDLLSNPVRLKAGVGAPRASPR